MLILVKGCVFAYFDVVNFFSYFVTHEFWIPVHVRVISFSILKEKLGVVK